MQLIKQFNKIKDCDTTVFKFSDNRIIAKVLITLDNNYVEYIGTKIKIEYALNGITTVLIPLKTVTVTDNKEFEIKVNTPIFASHIYITADNGVKFEDIKIYEIINNKLNNYYPAYFDTDLKENYYIDTVSVFTSPEGYSEYSVYTSINGRDFEFLAHKTDDKPCDFSKGDVYSANGREARIIRVYIEYNSASTEAIFDRVEFTGKMSETKIQERPEINIPSFNDSKYNVEVTLEDTAQELYGIIARRIGEEYKDWFEFEFAENPKNNGYDFFELSFKNEKIHIKGNSGVSLATGINHYLKYYCKVNISQVGDQVKMPETVVCLKNTVFKETKAMVRYAYNYCTLSYSMAFWGEKEWQEELDWLALNGVNVVLDTTAQEEVWRRFLTSLGYTHEEIIKFIAGPAYYAWAYMGNLSGFGGPVHDSWFSCRTELARKNHLKMRKLGMYPILQGYSGMVPNSITEHFTDIDVIPQDTWCSFERPTMLRTTAPVFKEFAQKFYKAQSEVYGNYSMYFASDPFHEGGKVGDMQAREISREILNAMLQFNKNAVWIIQSWLRNPTSELLAGLDLVPDGKSHALILDLYAEKDPNYKKGSECNPNYGYSKEFDSTPWIFCMLNNFGGRLGLHGHLDNLAKWIPEAYNTCNFIAGIGITPEASFNNPVLYDFLFELVWRDNFDGRIEVIDLNSWICDYAERRYGAKSENAMEAWKILLNTVYKAELNMTGQGAPESIVNARPSLESRPASSWGNAVIGYDKTDLKRAAGLLLSDYETMKDSMGYKYDLITVLQQVLSNTAQDVHLEMVDAYKNKDLTEFKKKSAEFLKIADLMDKVLSSNKYYLLGRWIEQAKALALNTDDFTKMLYEVNAKSLITTWGSYNQCETGGLRDYSNRQWSGLVGDFYKCRWEHWITNRINELESKPYEEKTDWFSWEWRWVRNSKLYSCEPTNIDILELSRHIIGVN